MEGFKFEKVVIIVCFFFTFNMSAGVFPNDEPAIEALIDSHKKAKKLENKTAENNGMIDVEYGFSTDFTKKYNKVRNTLNKRMGQVNSIATMVLDIINIGIDVEGLYEDYKSFNKLALDRIQNQNEHGSLDKVIQSSYAVYYYTLASTRIIKEIKHLSTFVVQLAGTNFNILKATDEEKYRLICTVKGHISIIRSIIKDASWKLKLLKYKNASFMNVLDFLIAVSQNEISDNIISLWKENSANYGK